MHYTKDLHAKQNREVKCYYPTLLSKVTKWTSRHLRPFFAPLATPLILASNILALFSSSQNTVNSNTIPR